jgi:hypothetical protein
MKKSLSKLTPIEVIVDIFIIMAVFVAMAAAFIIVLQTYNAGQAKVNGQLSSSNDWYSQSPNLDR